MNNIPHYLLIGNGRVSKHFQHYFKHLGLIYSVWYRGSNSMASIEESVHEASHILLLITDSAIDPFIEKNPVMHKKTLIHFSGSYQSKFAEGMHPLQTFNQNLYSIEDYKNIPFIINENGLKFEKIFPQLQNKYYAIPSKLRPYYHTLCVMANNFSCLLWQKLFSEFETKFKIPEEAIFQILEKSFSNLQSNWRTALTGPIARKDKKSMLLNLTSLGNDPYKEIFKAFINLIDIQG